MKTNKEIKRAEIKLKKEQEIGWHEEQERRYWVEEIDEYDKGVPSLNDSITQE